MSIAIFPGSFDPITNGHVDIVRKAAVMFEKIYVVIMTNTHKNYLFQTSERADFVKDSLKEFDNVEILVRPSQLTVNVAKELNAKAIIRGVRNTSDFLYEQQISGINEHLNSNIHTVLLFTNPENSFVASSMIKEVAKFNGDITQFLPKKAAEALTIKMRTSENE